MLQAHQQKIIGLMIEQERIIANIYKLFASRFPLHGDFWVKLEKWELERAEWIDHLQKLSERGKMTFDEGKIKTYTIAAFIDYLQKIIAEIKLDHHLKISRAFFLTREISSALMERNLFHCFEGHSRELKETLEILETESKEHNLEIDRYHAYAKANSPTWS